jgi:site-specific recombinase XerC
MTDATERERAEARKRLSVEASEWRSMHCWSPNQLRHSRATLLREKFGIEAAQVVLGHSDPKTTLVYAEAQFSKAAEIAKAIG